MTTPARLYLKRWSCEETFGTNRLAGRLIETAGSSPGLMWKEMEKRKSSGCQNSLPQASQHQFLEALPIAYTSP